MEEKQTYQVHACVRAERGPSVSVAALLVLVLIIIIVNLAFVDVLTRAFVVRQLEAIRAMTFDPFCVCVRHE
jgi:hypothetical protein